MRLINVNTLKFETFFGNHVPRYAVVSHFWEEDELILRELSESASAVRLKPAGAKVSNACRLAAQDGLEYLWIDTCCIDPSSSAETSEAINAMFGWFKQAEICYAYLGDVTSTDVNSPSFASSRYFMRGWTLSELIGPRTVVFYTHQWERICVKSDIVEKLFEITSVDPWVLAGGDVTSVKVGRRMSWGSRRTTTRVEDAAYCLFGLFDVNIPVIYGEGKKAFVRLQAEIMRMSADPTIFAWQSNSLAECESKYSEFNSLSKTKPPGQLHQQWFAESPSQFRECGAWIPPLVRDDDPADISGDLRKDAVAIEDYESDSDVSIPDSIFSTGSVASSQSSAQSLGAPQLKSALHEAVKLFTGSKVLQEILSAGVAKHTIGRQRMRVNFARLLRSMAKDLNADARDEDGTNAARFLRTYASRISEDVMLEIAATGPAPTEMTQWSDTRFPEHNEPRGSGDELEDAEEDVPDVGDVEPTTQGEPPIQPTELSSFSKERYFVMESPAYSVMIRRIHEFVHPTFISRAEKLIRGTQLDGDAETALTEKRRLTSLLSELEYARPRTLYLSHTSRTTWKDRFCRYVEETTGEDWDWWPMAPPRQPVGAHQVRLSWKCKCSDRREAVVPESLGKRLTALYRKYPPFDADMLPTVATRSSKSFTEPDFESKEGSGNPDSHLASTKQTMKFAGSGADISDKTPKKMTSPPPSPAEEKKVQINRDMQRPRFIFLLASPGVHRLKQLRSLHMTPEGFATELGNRYYQMLGWRRSWFSTYTFSHCDFVTFECYGNKKFSHRGHGLPDPVKQQAEYFYAPRPARFDPPISPEEFGDIFKYGKTRRMPSLVLPLFSTPDDLSDSVVRRVPQRYYDLDESGKRGANERFWGIHCRERRSFAMVALYVLACLSPSLAFAFLWIFRLGGADDLQNATVPLTLSLSLLAMFFSSIIVKQNSAAARPVGLG